MDKNKKRFDWTLGRTRIIFSEKYAKYRAYSCVELDETVEEKEWWRNEFSEVWREKDAGTNVVLAYLYRPVLLHLLGVWTQVYVGILTREGLGYFDPRPFAKVMEMDSKERVYVEKKLSLMQEWGDKMCRGKLPTKKQVRDQEFSYLFLHEIILNAFNPKFPQMRSALPYVGMMSKRIAAKAVKAYLEEKWDDIKAIGGS